MLIAEDLLLLVTDDASGRLSAQEAQVDAGLGGATLVELTLMRKVDLSGETDEGKPGRIVVLDPSPPGDDVLDAALEILSAHQGKKPSTLIALLHALKCEHKIVDPRPYGLSRRQLRARAEEIAEGNWASEAVRKVINEMIAAATAAASAAAAAGAS